VNWRSLLLGAPMGLGALGLGFWAQAVMPNGSTLNGPLLEAMLATPPPHAVPQSSAGDDLRGLAAERTAGGAGSLALAEPARGMPLALEIRVAVARGASQLQLSASGPWWLRGADGAVLREGAGGSVLSLSSADGLPAEIWLETSAGHAVSVNGQAYDGRLRVLRDSDGLLAVNHLPLEAYVASVVGAEMPSSWSMEALKAQAVAARSYALAHMARPASRHWHLGNTTRWQAYRGLASSTARTREAAALTSGLILSYQGGIVESLYAATSEISMEAHGHLGASMSQHGAQAMASSGQRYNQILGHYYRGAALARLRQGQG
jgi:peptidoglycan hydrolase-like amidase